MERWGAVPSVVSQPLASYATDMVRAAAPWRTASISTLQVASVNKPFGVTLGAVIRTSLCHTSCEMLGRPSNFGAVLLIVTPYLLLRGRTGAHGTKARRGDYM